MTPVVAVVLEEATLVTEVLADKEATVVTVGVLLDPVPPPAVVTGVVVAAAAAVAGLALDDDVPPLEPVALVVIEVSFFNIHKSWTNNKQYRSLVNGNPIIQQVFRLSTYQQITTQVVKPKVNI